MSTDTDRRAIARASALLPALLATLSACAPQRVASTLDALCGTPGAAVELAATLVIENAKPAAPEVLRQEIGRKIPLTLTFHPDQSPSPAVCPDRSGVVVYGGVLPAPLEQASAGSGNARWRIERDSVVIEFNPRVADNNLGLSVPIAGGPGRWWLSTFVGEVASGPVTRP